MLEQTSVTLSYTQGILQAAERNGICLPSDLCQQATAHGRTPMHIQDEVWEHYCAAADDSLAGLRLGLNLQVGHLDLVGMLLMSCETQGEALDLLLEYHPIVGEGGDFSLRHRGQHCLLSYEPHYQIRQRERVDAVLACVLNMARWVTGGHFEAEALQLTMPEPPAEEKALYENLLEVPVKFD